MDSPLGDESTIQVRETTLEFKIDFCEIARGEGGAPYVEMDLLFLGPQWTHRSGGHFLV